MSLDDFAREVSWLRSWCNMVQACYNLMNTLECTSLQDSESIVETITDAYEACNVNDPKFVALSSFGDAYSE
eukprot:4949459-Alexandrium_andersonii.AAC.1